MPATALQWRGVACGCRIQGPFSSARGVLFGRFRTGAQLQHVPLSLGRPLPSDRLLHRSTVHLLDSRRAQASHKRMEEYGFIGHSIFSNCLQCFSCASPLSIFLLSAPLAEQPERRKPATWPTALPFLSQSRSISQTINMYFYLLAAVPCNC